MRNMFLFYVLILLSLSIQSGLCKYVQKNASDSGICGTKECYEAAERLKLSINFSANPCENFYEYACGSWRESHPLPGTASRFSQLSLMMEQMNNRVQDILSTPIMEEDAAALAKVKRFYTACIDLDKQNSRGLSPLLAVIDQYGGWPLLDPKWDGSNFNLQNSIADLQRNLGQGILLDIGIQSDLKNTTNKKIAIDQPDFFLPRDYFLSTDFQEKIDAYKKFVKEVAVEMAGNSSLDEHALIQQIHDFIAFEAKIANISAKTEDRGNITKTYNLFTVESFQTHFDSGSDNSLVSSTPGYLHVQINWEELLNKIFENFTTISPSEEIIIAQPSYLRNLRVILQETPVQTIVNYFQWRMVSSFVDDTTNNLRDSNFEYLKTLQGVKKRQPRKEICSNFDISSDLFSLGEAVSSEYIKTNFPKEHKETVNEMVNHLRAAFSELLADATWMDDATKDTAGKKIREMIQFVGYPEFITNVTELNKHYQGFETDEGSHFENMLSLAKWEVDTELRQFRDPTDRNKMHGHAVFVNAVYEPEVNSITFPAAILAPPMYTHNGPASINFGGIGVVMGHEITHGFDTQGSQYDENGNVKDWWSPRIKEKFMERAQCFMDQYSNFSIPEGHVNGKMTVGENIADNGGVHEAYLAYQNWIRERNDNVEEPRLPGLEQLSHDQLFFLGFATTWCENVTPEKAQQLLLEDVHSPGRFRVIGGIMNSPKFAEAFDCPPQAPMNPENKCLLW